ncbi:hypothetical protein DM01DRAFT_1309068 [Hesseltinella vesiculosa]|uniref:P-loop containing nucleoside triphosphate hydrolase protein n=1 Tax=Hesseltinella vesiculosa TaxID=101127 RepID=A0A1X2GA85_9FUNG|nr:hypothetical protein DM01DRAFT_1309068 [Hesseltinella vesiculosa]
MEFAWASVLPSLTMASALVLAIQHPRCTTIQLPPNDNDQERSPAKTDYERDMTVPFSDDHRLPRLTFGTTVLFALAIYNLCAQTTQLDPPSSKVVRVVCAALWTVCWSYILALVVVARRYPLPSHWGFAINTHLFVLYLGAWVVAVQDAWVAFWDQSATSWVQALPMVLAVLLLTDMALVTLTTSPGPPFLDAQHRKPVLSVHTSSVWGYLTFGYLTRLVRTAYDNKTLTNDDLPVLPPEIRAAYLFEVFGRHRSSSLLYRIYRTNRSSIWLQAFYVTFASVIYYGPAFFMNRLLYLIQDISHGLPAETAYRQGLLIIVGLGLTTIGIAFVIGRLWYYAECSMKVRVKGMLNMEIYQKTMHRMDMHIVASSIKDTEDQEDTDDDDDTDEDQAKAGSIINLLGTDTDNISEFCNEWFNIFAAPLELAVGVFFLYKLIGVSCLVGLLVMVVFLPLNHYNVKIISKYQDRLMEARDKRVSLMHEIIQGIRQIKYFAWEATWEARATAARSIELDHMRRLCTFDVAMDCLWYLLPVLVCVISFYFYTVIQGHVLTAPVAFTSIHLFNELRFALNGIPGAIVGWTKALVSVRRIDQYLHEPELPERPFVQVAEPVQVRFTKATVAYRPTSKAGKEPNNDFTLHDLDMMFPKGAFSLVCGPTGSGKTTLLLSLLGETYLQSGQVHFPFAPVCSSHSLDISPIDEHHWILDHSAAYVAQTAWLQNATIKDNILFGLPFSESRYNDTLFACSLLSDLAAFEDGDLTEIGEKGITLSGGQKARVALARAVYSRAGILILDDILSAVDSHTAHHLYDHCLTGPLLHGRTRILVTHHVRLCLPAVDYVVHLDMGRLDFAGPALDLRRSGQLATIMDLDEGELLVPTDDANDCIEKALDDASSSDEKLKPDGNDASVDVKKNASPRVLVEEEGRDIGEVKWKNYKVYFQMAGGFIFWFLFTSSLVGGRALDIMEGWWMKAWSRASAASSQTLASDDTEQDVQVMYYIGIYALILFSNVIVSVVRFVIVYVGGLRVSKVLHEKLLHRLLHAPLRFFDTQPVGRVLNRFSNDIEEIDSAIPYCLVQFLVQWIQVISIMMIAAYTLPLFTIPIVVVAAANVGLGAMFVYASRELRRIESVTRSPILSHFTESVHGLITIRAYGATQQFLQRMIKYVDGSLRPTMLLGLVDRWISMRYGFMGTFISVVSAWLILLNLDHIDAAEAGFCLSFIFLFTDEMFYAINRYTSMEMAFNSMERAVEYLEISQEVDQPSVVPPAQWPSKGAIEIQNLQVRYANDLDLVLKGISASISSGEKIGIVGKTGCGKSTLTLSLFRFLEFVGDSKITIDGIDISQVSLHDLRSRLTIIPQDPVLFSGTLKSAIDPLNEFTDAEVLEALGRVHLIKPSPSASDAEATLDQDAPLTQNIFENLESPITEGGQNLSQGQRQLLCLARALLKRTSVVVLDEASSSVDFETDKNIQKSIRSELSNSTTLCVAHRLNTVIDYDRILVLNDGQLVEFDTPWRLINKTDSKFYGMCRKSGEFDKLYQTAKEKNLSIPSM